MDRCIGVHRCTTGNINLAAQTQNRRDRGVKILSSPPIPQNPLFRSRDFDGFEVIGDPQTLKIWQNSDERILIYCENILAQAYVSV